MCLILASFPSVLSVFSGVPKPTPKVCLPLETGQKSTYKRMLLRPNPSPSKAWHYWLNLRGRLTCLDLCDRVDQLPLFP